MSDILSVIDRRQGHAFEPLVKNAPPIVPALDPRLDALLSRIDEKYASSLSKEPSKLPARAPSEDIPQSFLKPQRPLFGGESSTDSGTSLSNLVKAQRELPNVPGGEQAFIKMESDVLRGMGVNPETGSRLPSPRGASAASSDIPMPFLRIPSPVEAAPIKRVPGSGKEEAVKDSGNEINMARVMKYDKERLDKLKRQLALSDVSPGVAKKLQQDAIKARTAWLRLNNLQAFGIASPENVSNFRM